MKRNKSLVMLVVAIVLGLTLILVPISSQLSPVQAAIDWTKYYNNPVLEEDTGWDEGGVGDASVILDGSTYRMWYTGLATGPVPAIGYATSGNGTSWTKPGSNPVLTKQGTGWEEDGVGSPSVIWDADASLYKMWYTGYKDDTPAIGYVESDDGIDWTNPGNRQEITWLGSTGAWEAAGVMSPSVIKDGSIYKMWYSGRTADSTIGGLQIGYAESTDGTEWTRSVSNPVLLKGTSGWDSRGVGVGCVIKVVSNYLMWYTGYQGYDEAGIEVAIGYASSSDGVSWTKDPGNPELEKGTTWEAGGVGAPSVMYAARTYRMWYSGLDTAFNPTIGYAEYTVPAGGGGGFGPGDITPPRISDISASGVNKTSADIYWETQELSDSQVEYWASPSMFSELDEEMVIYHHVRLTDLNPATTYYYKTMSKDRAGNLAVSDEYTLTTLGTPAAFTTGVLTISPTEVDIGESLTISVSVANTGDATGTHEITLEIDEAAVATKSVTLASGASQKVTFTTSQDVAKTYSVSVNGLSGSFVVKPPAPPAPSAPAAFTVSALSISPIEVDTGDTVTISILVTNTGDLTGSYEVTLKIDNKVVATKGVTLAGGASQKVIFTTSKDIDGTYVLNVNGLRGTFTVTALAVPPNWWLIGGIIAVVVAAVVFIWLNVIRRRAE